MSINQYNVNKLRLLYCTNSNKIYCEGTVKCTIYTRPLNTHIFGMGLTHSVSLSRSYRKSHENLKFVH